MFRQWLEAKRQHPEALLLFRMGDFYELFFDDAKIAAPILEIALTRRGKGTETEAPMCGVPHHAVDQYVARLVERGLKVAICEQMEDPRKTKKMVRREVVRVVSPGTVVDPRSLDPTAANWLAAVHETADGRTGIALVDLSTGSIVLSEADDAQGLEDVLARYEVREVLAAERAADRVGAHLPEIGGRQPALTPLDDDLFHAGLARERVLDGLGVATLSGFGCPDDHPALPAAAAALTHLADTQRVRPAHLDRLRVEQPGRVVTLDRTTRRNLELVANLRDGTRRATLLEVLDRTRTPMGARLLRGWVLEPLRDTAEIRARQDVIDDLVQRADLRAQVREALSGIRDVERIVGRAALGLVTPAELATLRASLERLPALRAALVDLASPRSRELAEAVDTLDELVATLRAALADEPGSAVGEGRVIREGWDEALDEARRLARGGRGLIAEIEARERARTGIGSLKVRYNRVFGYFIEVSKANLARVPDDYERRQTLASAERYVTPELRELETRILSAEDRLAERERALFDDLVAQVGAHASRVKSTAAAVAQVDALAGLAERAAVDGWTRPLVDEEDRIEIEDGRHPVVESLLPAGAFVPNDCRLDPQRRLLIVTGPNMGGKSTYLRQVALITILAQIGAFVPARAARIGLVDRVFCRVGASDNLAGGESTFMVEMTETANILHNATPRSLVILDEIGRGTATWDGMALAWSVVEHLHDDPRLSPKALFATHYHELTELAAELPRLANVHIAVREYGQDVVFLHRVEPGPSDRSYGIHVARLAGLPDRVVERAREILDDLVRRGAHAVHVEAGAGRSPQLPLFGGTPAPEGPREDPVARELRARLESIDPDELSPREAHRLLCELVDRLRRRPETDS
ncbi:MAG: DNA mismatch repair protein MutS [Acidobacteria bacterium]|nr:MAG: DNA mismatch repair protein MutS [Acidobacteriota bacterium]